MLCRVGMIIASCRDIIGNKGSLPWHMPEDLKRFKTITMCSTVIMGHNTYKSIGFKLPNRSNVVLTNDPSNIKYSTNGLHYVMDIEGALSIAEYNRLPIFIIGGASVYKMFERYIQYIYWTKVTGEEIVGDTRYNFSKLLENFDLVSSTGNLFENGFEYDFCEYKHKDFSYNPYTRIGLGWDRLRNSNYVAHKRGERTRDDIF